MPEQAHDGESLSSPNDFFVFLLRGTLVHCEQVTVIEAIRKFYNVYSVVFWVDAPIPTDTFSSTKTLFPRLNPLHVLGPCHYQTCAWEQMKYCQVFSGCLTVSPSATSSTVLAQSARKHGVTWKVYPCVQLLQGHSLANSSAIP